MKKFFQLESPYICQNNRIYAKNKGDTCNDDLVAPIKSWPQQLMVWGRINGKGNTQLVFTEKGEK